MAFIAPTIHGTGGVTWGVEAPSSPASSVARDSAEIRMSLAANAAASESTTAGSAAPRKWDATFAARKPGTAGWAKAVSTTASTPLTPDTPRKSCGVGS